MNVFYSTYNNFGSSKKLKILIADDDKLVRTYLNLVLKDVGKEFLFAKSGAEAVDKYLEHSDIDLILMDIRMPKMDGLEATRKIREINKDVQIFIESAYTEIGEKEQAFECGANYFVEKPIDKNKLLSVIFNRF